MRTNETLVKLVIFFPSSSLQVLVPWKSKKSNDSFLRYYHVFKENELQCLCEKVPGMQVLDSYYDDGNWCVQVQRVSLSH